MIHLGFLFDDDKFATMNFALLGSSIRQFFQEYVEEVFKTELRLEVFRHEKDGKASAKRCV